MGSRGGRCRRQKLYTSLRLPGLSSRLPTRLGRAERRTEAQAERGSRVSDSITAKRHWLGFQTHGSFSFNPLERRGAPLIPILQVNTLGPEEPGGSEQRFDFGLRSLDMNVLEDLLCVKESAFAFGI